MNEGYLGCLGIARALVGMAQSALMLGGCAGLLVGSDILISAAIQWFIILCGVQVAILGLAALAK